MQSIMFLLFNTDKSKLVQTGLISPNFQLEKLRCLASAAHLDSF